MAWILPSLEFLCQLDLTDFLSIHVVYSLLFPLSKLKCLFFNLHQCVGMPRYFPGLVHSFIWRIVEISILVDWGTHHPHTMPDFSKLILCPDDVIYIFRICTSAWASSYFAFVKKITSSAQNKWVRVGAPFASIQYNHYTPCLQILNL